MSEINDARKVIGLGRDSDENITGDERLINEISFVAYTVAYASATRAGYGQLADTSRGIKEPVALVAAALIRSYPRALKDIARDRLAKAGKIK